MGVGGGGWSCRMNHAPSFLHISLPRPLFHEAPGGTELLRAMPSQCRCLPPVQVDGMDVLAVKQACHFAKEFAIENGPIILEMDTYR